MNLKSAKTLIPTILLSASVALGVSSEAEYKALVLEEAQQRYDLSEKDMRTLQNSKLKTFGAVRAADLSSQANVSVDRVMDMRLNDKKSWAKIAADLNADIQVARTASVDIRQKVNADISAERSGRDSKELKQQAREYKNRAKNRKDQLQSRINSRKEDLKTRVEDRKEQIENRVNDRRNQIQSRADSLRDRADSNRPSGRASSQGGVDAGVNL